MTRDDDLRQVQREIVEAWWSRLSEGEKQDLIDRHYAASVAWANLSPDERQRVLNDLWFATRPADGDQPN